MTIVVKIRFGADTRCRLLILAITSEAGIEAGRPSGNRKGRLGFAVCEALIDRSGLENGSGRVAGVTLIEDETCSSTVDRPMITRYAGI